MSDELEQSAFSALINKIVHDPVLKQDVLNIFKINQTIASIVERNSKDSRDRLKELREDKRKIAESNRQEAQFLANDLKKNPGSEQPFSKKFTQDALQLQRLSKAITALEQAGAENIIIKRNQQIQQNEALSEVWHALNHIYRQLPEGTGKQWLHALLVPKASTQAAEQTFDKILAKLQQYLQSSKESSTKAKPASAATTRKGSVSQMIAEDVSVPSDAAPVVADRTTSKSRAIPAIFNEIWKGIKAAYAWVTPPKTAEARPSASSVVTTVDEDASTTHHATATRHTASNGVPSNWLSDNFPPRTASWVGRIAKRITSLLGLGTPSAPASTQTKAASMKLQDLLIATDKLLRAHAKMPAQNVETIDAYLSEGRVLKSKLTELNRDASLPIKVKAIDMLKQLEQTLITQRASLTQKTVSSPQDEVIQSPRLKK